MLRESLGPIPIGNWIENNSNYITSVLSDYLLKVKWMEPVKSNLDKRSLSELWLCGAFKDIDELPIGYTRTPGKVYIGDRYEPTGHIFAMSEDEVLCITPGEFISPTDDTLKKGDRIRRLVSLDPSHIFVRGELAVLHGNVKDIEKSYGLRYVRG